MKKKESVKGKFLNKFQLGLMLNQLEREMGSKLNKELDRLRERISILEKRYETKLKDG